MSVTPMSVDHKPGMPLEKQRIIKNGGRVQQIVGARGQLLGPKRVWLKDQELPGLAMSRSIGDYISHTVGVSAEPEIKKFTL